MQKDQVRQDPLFSRGLTVDKTLSTLQVSATTLSWQENKPGQPETPCQKSESLQPIWIEQGGRGYAIT